MDLKTPQSLKVEHEELHAQLSRATKADGATGDAALAVAKALRPHFLKEEEYALPPLALLPALAGGQVGPDARDAVDMAERLKADLDHMLLEHNEIVGALQVLTKAAKQEGKDGFVHFALISWPCTLKLRKKCYILPPSWWASTSS
jgi:hypothetical protein